MLTDVFEVVFSSNLPILDFVSCCCCSSFVLAEAAFPAFPVPFWGAAPAGFVSDLKLALVDFEEAGADFEVAGADFEEAHVDFEEEVLLAAFAFNLLAAFGELVINGDPSGDGDALSIKPRYISENTMSHIKRFITKNAIPEMLT